MKAFGNIDRFVKFEIFFGKDPVLLFTCSTYSDDNKYNLLNSIEAMAGPTSFGTNCKALKLKNQMLKSRPHFDDNSLRKNVQDFWTNRMDQEGPSGDSAMNLPLVPASG